MNARRKNKPDTGRLKNGLATGTEFETTREEPPAKGRKPARYRKRVSALDSVRSIRLGKGAIIALICAALLVGATVLISEPWVRPREDDYVAPSAYESLEPAVIGVGERWSFGLEPADNVRITDIIVSDPDILSAGEGEVVALGEYYKTSVTFAVEEAELPSEEYERIIRIGSLDLTESYNALRSRLRALLGIEAIRPERTELRTLRLCEQRITVSGLDGATDTQPTVTLDEGDEEDIELLVTASEGYEARSTDEGVVVISEYGETPGVFTISAENAGSASIEAVTGFWKSVDAETYSEYLASGPSLPSIAGVGADETAAARPNEVFVRSRRIVFPVEVAG